MKRELRSAFKDRRVFLTGHTGFKGSWLALWLLELGAEVHGYALTPHTQPNLFSSVGLESLIHHEIADVRDVDALRNAIRAVRPDFVLHLAAQPLVRLSYEAPLATIQTNVLGTANLLEALRLERIACAVVIVTSDKCYENREWTRAYREDDAMGGHDVYSMSKGAAELVVASYRRSFFQPSEIARHGVALASARAGNAIGGGDWAADRLIPDIMRALVARRPVEVRDPGAVRPWQHVLEPLSGYLRLAAKLALPEADDRAPYCDAWNFGPSVEDCRTVRELVESVIAASGSGEWKSGSSPNAPHEAKLLRLDTDKAVKRLGWRPRWSLEEAVQRTVDWYRAHQLGASVAELRSVCVAQIDDYMREVA